MAVTISQCFPLGHIDLPTVYIVFVLIKRGRIRCQLKATILTGHLNSPFTHLSRLRIIRDIGLPALVMY